MTASICLLNSAAVPIPAASLSKPFIPAARLYCSNIKPFSFGAVPNILSISFAKFSAIALVGPVGLIPTCITFPAISI